jgi:hypothetical protein
MGCNSTHNRKVNDYYSSIVIIKTNKSSETPERMTTHLRVNPMGRDIQRRHIQK